jgi:hypothetical protein
LNQRSSRRRCFDYLSRFLVLSLSNRFHPTASCVFIVPLDGVTRAERSRSISASSRNILVTVSLDEKPDMKLLALPLLACLLFFSCKNEYEDYFDICGKGIEEFKKDTLYEGTISFCNAQPPLQSWIPGVATATFIGEDAMQIHLVADSIGFDTSFLYLIKCGIAEEIYPHISLVGETINDDGYYTDGFRHITFAFGNPNCTVITRFDGKSKR